MIFLKLHLKSFYFDMINTSYKLYIFILIYAITITHMKNGTKTNYTFQNRIITTWF